MGSSVSSIAGILAASQTGDSITGSKEDDLKIQFAEVMSQMTTQVGVGSYTKNQNAFDGKTSTTDMSVQTDSYEQYQYCETNIKQQSSAVDNVQKDQLTDKVETYENDVKEVLKEELGVSDEQIEAAMEQLGMTAIDLMDTKQLANLVTELTGCEDIGQLLCNSDFLDVLKEVETLTAGLLEELGLTTEEVQLVFDQMSEEQLAGIVPDNMGMEELKTEAEISEFNQTATEISVEEAAETMDNSDIVNVSSNQNASSVKEVSKEEASEAEEAVPNKVAESKTTDISERDTTEEKTETDTVEKEQTVENLTEKKTDTNSQQQAGSQTNQQNHTNENVVVQNNNQQNLNVQTAEAVPEFTRQLDTENIIKQIVEFTKLNVSNTQTTLEMQLNPENLGKIFLEVTTKQGSVSAHIIAQNEFVKEALESQITELRQNMNQAGVKVDAVEVTVGSHEFERNLEQNEKEEERQAEEREKASVKTRRLNLDSLDELSGIMTEEEALVAQMMADYGNSIDYTA